MDSFATLRVTSYGIGMSRSSYSQTVRITRVERNWKNVTLLSYKTSSYESHFHQSSGLGPSPPVDLNTNSGLGLGVGVPRRLLKDLQEDRDHRRHRSASASGQGALQIQPTPKGTDKNGLVRRIDDDLVKRRCHGGQGYELSQDLLDKQVEMLERKYGGLRARRAATTIQRAWRAYLMQRRFRDITQQVTQANKDGLLLSSTSLTGSARRLARRAVPSILSDGGLHHQHFYHHNYFSGNYTANNPYYQQWAYSSQHYQLPPQPPTSQQTAQNGGLTAAIAAGGVASVATIAPLQASAPIGLQQTALPQATGPVSEVMLNPGSLEETMTPSALTGQGGLERHHGFASHSVGSLHRRKMPPQVPKRTCSMQRNLSPMSGLRGSHCESTGSETSLVLETSVSSHGSSSDLQSHHSHSPLWGASGEEHDTADKRLSNISEDTCDTPGYAAGNSHAAADALLMYPSQSNSGPCHNLGALASPAETPSFNPADFKQKEIERKRHYRVGLNLFNKKPERGIRYLIEKNFLEGTPQAVARFLMTRKGLSKNKIGEYLGDRQNPFAVQVLECSVREMDLSGMQVDVALRKFQSYFQMPGEAQKVDHVIQMFSLHYADCNPDLVAQFFKNADNVLVVAFSIVMLNVDLHNPSLAEHRRMKVDDYIKNLRGVEGFENVDRATLAGIYDRIKKEAFRPGSDHVTQVAKVHETIVGAKKPNLVLPHRRLVCYCRLYEVYDIQKKDKAGQHQREVFLFNDLLLVSKIASKKKGAITYSFRQSIPLVGLNVTLFSTPHYPFGISLSQRVDGKIVITLNARNEHDREKFCDDLRESVLEMDEMEALRIEAELEKQSASWANQAENRDSGVATDEDVPNLQLPNGSPASDKADKGSSSSSNGAHGGAGGLKGKGSALSNSLLDLAEPPLAKPVRRGSAGSLDSGMSVSFQSSAASTASRDSSPQTVPASAAASAAAAANASGVAGVATGGINHPQHIQHVQHVVQHQHTHHHLQQHNHPHSIPEEQILQQQQPPLGKAQAYTGMLRHGPGSVSQPPPIAKAGSLRQADTTDV
ncbi:IQ motif and SEC7 domain-containing protein 2-like isoform X2 [Varroa jacobsoni]|uniref:SEC7 domain-containing protein n=1 Tax=Varroa destructor TaxID=109461 RepID=A0A7M7M3Y7_VARDE|nr:IQ motif and SEC7 domain-containing protein 2-like isoform X4 [Varroa destructor]XP_022693293.1 IQ motif and SEC7 domain-containing protein 2-like isoform X2 [Varroa jacobsoni]